MFRFVEDFKIEIEMLNGVKVSKSILLDDESIELEGLIFRKRITSRGTCYGIMVNPKEECSLQAKFYATLKLNRKDVKPTFTYEKEDVINAK